MQETKTKILKKITKTRLKNIALYYLQRFETSTQNLKEVLMRRVKDYAYQNKDFDSSEPIIWIDEIVAELEGYGYINDERYAKMKIGAYLNSGKSLRYIKTKLAIKGIEEDDINNLVTEFEYDPFEAALKLAKKKKLGINKEKRQKDLAAIVRAGFDYDIAKQVILFLASEESIID